ncbi:MAG: IS200/IS605 family transposase [Bacteroidota bacterium]
MANTHTQIYIQAVFAIKNREARIAPSWEKELHAYMGGILKQEGHSPIIINGMDNHIHLFFGLNPNQSISKCMQLVKGNSSKWVNDKGYCNSKFQWQSGYGAFSYARSQMESVYSYVANQKQHHQKRTFQDEYRDFLTKFDIPFQEEYLLEDI